MRKMSCWGIALLPLAFVLGCKGEAGKVYAQLLDVTTDVGGLERAAACERVPELKQKLDDARADLEKAKVDDDKIDEQTKSLKDAVDDAKAKCDKNGKPTTDADDEVELDARERAMQVMPAAMELYRRNQLGNPASCYESMKKLAASEQEFSRKLRCKALDKLPDDDNAVRTVSKLSLFKEQLDWTLEREKKKAKDEKADKGDDDDDKADDKKKPSADKQRAKDAGEFLASWKSDHCPDAKDKKPFTAKFEQARAAARVCLPGIASDAKE